MQILNEMATSIVSVEEEESKVRNELGKIILKEEKEHGPLEARLAMLKEEYKVLTNLELELINIMEKGNIITYEKGSQAKNSRSSPSIRRDSHRKESESSTDSSITVQSLPESPMLPRKSIMCEFSTNETNPDEFIHTKPKENTSNRDIDEKSNSLGKVAWERIFNELELPYTDFMGQSKKVITREQFQQLNNNIINEMGNNKQEYCNTDHHTLQQAKDRLHALLTSTMMGNVEYI